MSKASDGVLIVDAMVTKLTGGVNAGNAATAEGAGTWLGVAQTIHSVVDLGSKGLQTTSAAWGRYVPGAGGAPAFGGLVDSLGLENYMSLIPLIPIKLSRSFKV